MGKLKTIGVGTATDLKVDRPDPELVRERYCCRGLALCDHPNAHGWAHVIGKSLIVPE